MARKHLFYSITASPWNTTVVPTRRVSSSVVRPTRSSWHILNWSGPRAADGIWKFPICRLHRLSQIRCQFLCCWMLAFRRNSGHGHSAGHIRLMYAWTGNKYKVLECLTFGRPSWPCAPILMYLSKLNNFTVLIVSDVTLGSFLVSYVSKEL